MTDLENMTREQLIGQIMYLRSKVSQLERAIMAIPTHNEGWEDRSAIQGTNPGLAELIKERKGAYDE